MGIANNEGAFYYADFQPLRRMFEQTAQQSCKNNAALRWAGGYCQDLM